VLGAHIRTRPEENAEAGLLSQLDEAEHVVLAVEIVHARVGFVLIPENVSLNKILSLKPFC
jgi:hypothetical protein